MASFLMAVLAAIGFTTLFCILTFLTLKLRTWFLYMMILATAMEACGLISRAISIQESTSPAAFLISYGTLILAPSLAAAGCYMVFGRLIYLATPASSLNAHSLWVAPRWITRIFVLLDLGSFAIQFLGLLVVAGSYDPSMSAKVGPDAISRGEHIIILGLIVQLLCFGLFGILVVRFLCIGRHWPVLGVTDWHVLAWVINGAAGLITVGWTLHMLYQSRISNRNRGVQSTGLSSSQAPRRAPISPLMSGRSGFAMLFLCFWCF